jgi:hypothetical protein
MLFRKTPFVKPFLFLLGVGVFTLNPAGCDTGKDRLVPVEGKVTVGDKPLPTGYVIFYPDAAKGNTSREEPRADIDPQGNYKLLTGARAGATPGWYQVAVMAADQTDPKNPYFTKWLIPERYTDRQKSKLAFQVVEKPAAGAYDIKLDPK